MPHPHPVDPGAGAQPPVPVGIFLASTPTTHSGTGRLPAGWYGLDARSFAHLIATYTRPRDVVVDLDGHPMVRQVARYLRCHPATLVAGPDPDSVRIQPVDAVPAWRRVGRRGAGLLLACLPRPGCFDLAGLRHAFVQWRGLLRDGGYVLTILSADRREADPAGHRTAVIAAARAAGLRYHQHLLVVRVALGEREPRAEADIAAAISPRLLDGRHVRAHTDLLVFAADQEAADERA
jgi:hypothetical protein